MAPEYKREELYNKLRYMDRSKSSNLMDKKNLLRMKRSLGQSLEPRSESVSRTEQNRPIIEPDQRKESTSS